MRAAITGILMVLVADARADKQCDARMTELSARLVTLVPGQPSPHGHAIPHAKRATPATNGSTIIVDASGKAALPGAVGDTLEKQLEMRLGQHPPDEIFIAADPAVSVMAVADASRAVHSALPKTHVRLLVELGPAVPVEGDKALLAIPSVAALRDAIAKDPEKRNETVAKVMEKAMEPCSAIVKVYTELGRSSHATPAATLATEVPNAIKQCGCKMTDVDVVVFGHLAIYGAFDARLGWVTLPAIPYGDKRVAADLVK